MYIRIGTDVPVVSSPPDAIVLVVLGGCAALDSVSNRPFPSHLPPGDYMGAAPCHQERGDDVYEREDTHLGDVSLRRVRFVNWWSTLAVDPRWLCHPGLPFCSSDLCLSLSLSCSRGLPSLNLPHLTVPSHRMTRSILVSGLGLFFCERWQLRSLPNGNRIFARKNPHVKRFSNFWPCFKCDSSCSINFRKVIFRQLLQGEYKYLYVDENLARLLVMFIIIVSICVYQTRKGCFAC